MQWTSIRTDRDTTDALNRYRDTLQVAVNKKPQRYPAWLRKTHVGLADALRWLLHLQGEHTRRCRKAREKKQLDQRYEIVEDGLNDGQNGLTARPGVRG